ncbi:polysaccharide lyase family 7 protein [Lutibacter sp.]|uniref:polysaccharide lyase family 7 protein n=1 Tax=Lutibacter sp. TaxID=1925666 RepID=UPI0025BD9D36|nr:polysaccharide lyase family 7 protein [Lutibacter sp.]MCF6181277.1 polysaccharide lyase family 7 protein [Lutibacter sp.]
MLLLSISVSCQENVPNKSGGEYITPADNNQGGNSSDYKLPKIDLSHWKVTLPIGNPTEVYPPEILDYATNETLKPFMYNDSINGAIVFYTYPGATTSNTSYSRTELRELIDPNNLNVNWTFAQGGNIKGVLSMDEISMDENGDYNRAIIMQIHGRLTNAQRDLIGQSDNNAPPMLKIYWVDGKVRVKTKVLKDLNTNAIDILKTNSWGDDDGYTFPEYVGFDKFTLEVKVSKDKMEVILNDNASVVYDDISIQKWGVFENYFKAGNYLVSKNKDSFARVKYYSLVVTH